MISGSKSPMASQDGLVASRSMKGPMPTPTKVRTVLYSLIIAFGVIVSPFAILHALFSRTGHLQEFASVTAGISFITWIWASVLLSYHRRPFLTSVLTHASTHLYSAVVLSILELACGIMVLSAKYSGDNRWGGVDECLGAEKGEMGLCWLHGLDAALTLALCLLWASLAIYIFMRTKKGGGSLSRSNVAEFDGEGPAATKHYGNTTQV
ncbi:hypothetical protein PM082_011777 [Marasmius tenuissimus]|nr:hypothetical protein PM082_011777 [Marasmius tenuissimus]